MKSPSFSLYWRKEEKGEIRRDSSGHIYSPRMRSKRHVASDGREKCVASFIFLLARVIPHPLSPPLLDLQRNRVDPRISRRRDLENDVSGSSKPVDEIRMIDGVSGSRGLTGSTALYGCVHAYMSTVCSFPTDGWMNGNGRGGRRYRRRNFDSSKTIFDLSIMKIYQ